MAVCVNRIGTDDSSDFSFVFGATTIDDTRVFRANCQQISYFAGLGAQFLSVLKAQVILAAFKANIQSVGNDSVWLLVGRGSLPDNLVLGPHGSGPYPQRGCVNEYVVI